MGLLRRTARPSKPLPGDWMDALQAAMWVDPSLRPKRDPLPFELPVGEEPPAEPAPPEREVPRRFRTPPVAGRRFSEMLDEPVAEPAEVEAAPDAPEPQPVIPSPPSAKAWLLPVERAPAAPALPAMRTAAAPPAAVEELLQWVCRLSRLRRASRSTDAFAAETLRSFAELHLSALAAANPTGLRLRGPLASFVDVVMMRAGLPLSGQWRPLGPVPPERAYGLAVAEAAADPTGLHDGSWAVHHAALSLVADLLPPVGDFPGGPAVLDQLDVKLHGVVPPADDRICPAAYEGVFDHAIVRPVGRPIRAVAAAAVGLLLLAVAGAVLLNLRYVGQLRGSVDAVDRALREQPKSVQPQMNADVRR